MDDLLQHICKSKEEAEATYAEMPWNKLKRLRRSGGDIIAYLGEKVKKDFKLRVE